MKGRVVCGLPWFMHLRDPWDNLQSREIALVPGLIPIVAKVCELLGLYGTRPGNAHAMTERKEEPHRM
jgi:hypothetical protein